MDTVVLDASVGVKWFKDEPGSDEARRIIDRLGDGVLRVVVPAVFPHEVLEVARRLFGHDYARAVWSGLDGAGVIVAGVDAGLVRSALEVSEQLGCTLYEAAAPALAARLGCPLVSADRRAHGRLEGTVFVA